MGSFESKVAAVGIYFFPSYINPLVPDAHYSEHQDKPFSLQTQKLEVDLKFNCGF